MRYLALLTAFMFVACASTPRHAHAFEPTKEESLRLLAYESFLKPLIRGHQNAWDFRVEENPEFARTLEQRLGILRIRSLAKTDHQVGQRMSCSIDRMSASEVAVTLRFSSDGKNEAVYRSVLVRKRDTWEPTEWTLYSAT